MTADSVEMANLLANQYDSVFSSPSTTPPTIEESNLPINNIEIQESEIIEVIDELKSSGSGSLKPVSTKGTNWSRGGGPLKNSQNQLVPWVLTGKFGVVPSKKSQNQLVPRVLTGKFPPISPQFSAK